MYVADRDTYNDFYCGECGNIADHHADGLCEECYQDHHAVNKRFWQAFRETLIAAGWSVESANHADHIETLRVECGLYDA